MAALDSLAELNTILEEWNDENAAAGFATSNPVPKLTRLAELVEKETEAFYKMDPDPFDDRHPGRANPSCTLGHLFKALFKNEEFMNRLVSSYILHQRDSQIQILACRLLYDILPGLETSVVFQETEGLVEQLFRWAESGDEPIRSYATGLLAGAMEIVDVASNFKEKNSAMVPIMFDRLHALQKEMHEEFKRKEEMREDENKRHFSMFGSHSMCSITSPMKSVSVFKSPSKCDISVSPNAKSPSKSGNVNSAEKVTSDDNSDMRKVSSDPLVSKTTNDSLANPVGSKVSETSTTDVSMTNSSAETKDTKTDINSTSDMKTNSFAETIRDHLTAIESMTDRVSKLKDKLENQQNATDGNGVTVSVSQTPCCSSADKPSTDDVNTAECKDGVHTGTGAAITNGTAECKDGVGGELDVDSEDEVKQDDKTVEDRKARLKRTLSPSFYRDDVYRLKKQRTGNDSFIMSDVSNSSWAEIQPYVIGSYSLEPLTIGMKQRLILQYLTPMGEYQELIHAAFEHNAMDLIFYYINLKYNRDVRLAFEALKYLAVLVCHKKFAIKFLNRSGVQKLLDVYRPSIAATGVSLCFYYLSYFEDAMERVCLVSDHLLTTLVNYMLWLLECSHDSSTCHAALFFTQAFPFTVILNRFDAHDGLRRLYNVMSTLEILNIDSSTDLNDEQVFTMRQSARHVCVALRRYFEAHLILKVNELKRSHARNEGGSPQHETPGYKAMKITPEMVQENIELMMELMPVRQQWQPEATFHKLGGITLLTQLVGMSQDWSNYTGKPETLKAALDVIALCCVTPKSQLQLLTSIPISESVVTPAISIFIGLAEGDIFPDPEVQKSALSVIINCVCGPLERLGGGVGRYMGSCSKKKVNFRLGEDILSKMWNGVRENNGIMVLLKLLTIKAPITDADCIRALACKALVGMARSETVRQIISKLPLFSNGQLQSLMKEPVLQDKRKEHVKFCRYATELIERVSGKQTQRYSDATLDDLRKADIVAKSQINYNGKELILLIIDHLQKVGYHEAADVLMKEATLPRCTTPPPSHFSSLHVFPPAHGTTASLYSPTSSSLHNPRPLNRQLSLTDHPSSSPTLPAALANLPSTNPNIHTTSPQSAFSSRIQTPHAGQSGTSQHGSQSSLSPHSTGRISSGMVAQPSTAQHNMSTPISANTPNSGATPNSGVTPSGSGTLVAPIRFTIGRQAHQSQSTPSSQIHRNIHQKIKYQKERENTPFSPAVRKGFLQKTQNDYEMSLDKIVTEYLRKQHALCRNPVVTCPTMSLFQPHQCPEPRGNSSAQLSFTSRTYKKMINPKYGGFDGCKLDRKFIYSRFKPMITIKESEDDGFSCCTFANTKSTQQYVMLGTYGGNLKLVNAQSGEETGSFHCHSSPITHCEHSRDGKIVLTATTYGIGYSSAMWSWGSETLDNVYNFEDHYLEFSRQQQDRLIGTKDETANIYDASTGERIVKLYDADKANNYKANRAIFSPTDDLVLNDGVLWDVRSGTSIHKFDKFNQYVSGVFHPLGLEIIINSEVWDIRSFRLLHTVPALDQCQIRFNYLGDVMYATHIDEELEHETERHSPYGSTFRTFDATNYAAIATTDVKSRSISDLCTDTMDTFLAVVENQQSMDIGSDENICRLYEIGKVKDNDEQNEEEEEEQVRDDDEDDDDDDDDDVDDVDDFLLNDDDDDDDNDDDGDDNNGEVDNEDDDDDDDDDVILEELDSDDSDDDNDDDDDDDDDVDFDIDDDSYFELGDFA